MKISMTDHDEHLEEAEMIEISVIKLFNRIRQNIEDISIPPLTKEALEINTDFYEELGSGANDGVTFAHIGLTFPKRFTDLPFDMAFSEEGVALAVGGGDYIFSHYEHLGDNEDDIADKLTNLLISLANGQVALLNSITQDDEKVQAWEVLYRAPGQQLYDALATYAIFDSARKLKNRQMTTQKFANTADIDDVALDLDTYRAFMFETNWLTKFNRRQIAGLHTPLTRTDWEKTIDTYYDDKANAFTKKMDAWTNTGDNKSVMQQMLHVSKWRHLELLWWSIALMLYQPIVKGSLESLPFGFYVFGAYVIAATIYRNNPAFRKYFTPIPLAAYLGFILASFLYVMYSDGSTWWIILGVASLIALLENIFFDLYFLRLHHRDKRA